MRNQAEINKKISLAMKKRVLEGIYVPSKPFKKGYDPRRAILTNEIRMRGGLSNKTRLEKIYQETLFEDLGIDSKRRRVIEEQKYKCIKCHRDKWLGLPIVLELEHKDGNNKNNTRKNLEALCPNCHSQTPTWRKQKKVGVAKRKRGRT